MSQNTKLKELKQKSDQLHEQWMQSYGELQKSEREVRLPLVKQKYEGKYFKFRNNYSCPKENEYWYIYSHCTEIKGESCGVVISFEVDIYGKAEYRVDFDNLLTTLQEEISFEEYKEAFENFANTFIKQYQP